MTDRDFVWDFAKAHANLLKHGVSFEEAGSVFKDPLAVEIDDPYHSDVESRSLLIGMSSRSRILIVVHVERGDRVRIISARKATRQEREDYEKGND
jgi:uncharacterized DUF497 family protein